MNTRTARPILLAVIVAALAFTSPGLRASQPAEGSMTLPMEQGHQRPVVSLTIDGSGSLLFLLDTGAGGNVIRASHADALDLEIVGTQRAMNPTDGLVREVHEVLAKEVSLSGLELSDVPMMAIDLPQLGELDGVLSVHALPASLVTFDYPGREVRLDNDCLTPGDGVMPYSPSPITSLTARVDGQELVMHLDTGSPDGITLPGALARDLSFSGELEVIRERGPLVVKEGRLEGTVEIGALALVNPIVQVVDLFPDFGNIGSGFLADKVLILDQEHKLLRIVP